MLPYQENEVILKTTHQKVRSQKPRNENVKHYRRDRVRIGNRVVSGAKPATDGSGAREV
jgi:hypothetical protein